jgi:hypothetical protein
LVLGNYAEEIRDVGDNVSPGEGRDAVLSVPFLFFETCKRRIIGLGCTTQFFAAA